ncbi:hypothetical protein LguiA_033036 [Lonicera macranthoides]
MASEISFEEEGLDQQTEHCGSYNLSAAVSESKSSSSFSYRRYNVDGVFCTLPSSPFACRSFTGPSGFLAELPPPVIRRKMEED